MPVVELFNNIYTTYYARSFRFANLYVRNELVAEDIATESLVKLWETMKKESVENPQALLLAILKHKSLDYLKSKAHEQEILENMEEWRQHELAIRISTLEACNPDSIFSKEIHSIMDDTLRKLPDQTRKIFIMSRFENKSGKDIANILGITVKGVDYHISKALKALRIALKDYLPFIPFLFIN